MLAKMQNREKRVSQTVREGLYPNNTLKEVKRSLGVVAVYHWEHTVSSFCKHLLQCPASFLSHAIILY